MIWSVVVAATSLRAALRRRPAWREKNGWLDAALMIRPCAGLETSLLESLESTAAARSSFPVAVRFAIAISTDAAGSVAETACETLRRSNIDAKVVVTNAVGPNRKADQLARTLSMEAGGETVVIIADSDVDLRGVSLDELVAPLSDPRVAAVWAPPFEPAPLTLADCASAAVLDSSLHSFTVLSSLDGHGMVGKLMAARLSAVRAVGGFESLVHCLGEDMSLAARLRSRGHEVAVASVLAPSLARGRCMTQVVMRYARWVSVIRGQRRGLLLAYPCLFFATPIVVTLSMVSAAGSRGLSVASVLLVGISRVGVALLARSRVRVDRTQRPSLLTDIFLADALLFVAFLVAIWSPRLEWRGARLRIDSNGTLREDDAYLEGA